MIFLKWLLVLRLSNLIKNNEKKNPFVYPTIQGVFRACDITILEFSIDKKRFWREVWYKCKPWKQILCSSCNTIDFYNHSYVASKKTRQFVGWKQIAAP